VNKQNRQGMAKRWVKKEVALTKSKIWVVQEPAILCTG